MQVKTVRRKGFPRVKAIKFKTECCGEKKRKEQHAQCSGRVLLADSSVPCQCNCHAR